MNEKTPHPARRQPTPPAAPKGGWPWRFALLLIVFMAGIVLAGQFWRGSLYQDRVDWRDSYQAAAEEAQQTGKPLLVVFGADWCPPCEQMKAWVYSDQGVADSIEQDFVPVRVDMTDEGGPDQLLAARYGVSGYPTLLVLDPKGNPIDGWAGYLTKADLLLWLNRASTISAASEDTAPVSEGALWRGGRAG